MPYMTVNLAEDAQKRIGQFLSRIGDNVHHQIDLWVAYNYHVLWAADAIEIELVCRHSAVGHRRTLPFYEIQAKEAKWADEVVKALREECEHVHPGQHVNGMPVVVDPNLPPGGWLLQAVGAEPSKGHVHPIGIANPLYALAHLFPALTGWSVYCPGAGERIRASYSTTCHPSDTARLSEVIIHLNDHHHWSRQQIADWLDTLDLDLTIQPTSTGD